MADIIDLVSVDHFHVMCWAAQLGQLNRQRDKQVSAAVLAMTWQTLASLVDLHMKAEDEVCTPAIFGTGRRGLARTERSKAEHRTVRAIIAEASLHPLGSPPWWELAQAAMVAWCGLVDQEEHGPVGAYRRRANPALRQQLTTRWRAFTDARIRDRYPQAPPGIPVHRLRQQKRAPLAVPRLASPVFGPLACICQTCNDQLDQAFAAAPDQPRKRQLATPPARAHGVSH